MAEGPFSREAHAQFSIERLLDTKTKNIGLKMRLEKRKQFYLRMAEYLALPQIPVRGRLFLLQEWMAKRHPDNWCVCNHCTQPIPLNDHMWACAVGQALRDDQEDASRGPSQPGIGSRADSAKRSAKMITKEWEAGVPDHLSSSTLQHILTDVSSELYVRNL